MENNVTHTRKVNDVHAICSFNQTCLLICLCMINAEASTNILTIATKKMRIKWYITTTGALNVVIVCICVSLFRSRTNWNCVSKKHKQTKGDSFTHFAFSLSPLRLF